MEIERLEQELTALRRDKKVHDAQNRLFELFINMARSSRETKVLNATMRAALNIAVQYSGAENGSIFILNPEGVVTDSILIQEKMSREKRSGVIGRVLDKGLAGWVKDHLKVGLVADTEKDERWITLSKQSYIVRSVLSVPILRHETLFGIMTLMHPEPGHFDESAVYLIQQVANQMSIAIENAKLYEKLERSKEMLEQANRSIETYSNALNNELEKGKKIQKDFLPRRLPEVENCDVAACFHSALQLSGDFYDMFELPENHVGFVIGDVSDKGVGSALFMALIRSLLRIFSGSFNLDREPVANDGFLPRDALKAVNLTNEYIAKEHGEESMFVTLFFGIINPSDGTVFYINGGHEPILVVDKTGIKKSLNATGPALGPIKGAAYRIETFQLERGDILFGYTDGITEARAKNNEFYTRTRLNHFINRGFDVPTGTFLKAIESDLFDFIADAPQSDDITMLAMRWHPFF